MQTSKTTVVLCLAIVLTGCAMRKYRPAPIAPVESAGLLQARTLSDTGLRAFLDSRSQHPMATWPLAEWNLSNLTLAAFYYNPALQIAQARVSQAEGGIVTASARPNPSVTSDLGGETDPKTPWIAGAGFSLPLETAGKRRHRISQAEQLADAARWNLAISAWAVRSQVRSALLERLIAVRSLALSQSEERLRAEQVHLLEQRFAVGLIPRPEVDSARIQHARAVLSVRTGEGRISQADAVIASAIGVPTAALNGIHIGWPTLDDPPDIASLPLADIQRDAVLNRLDIRKALADYSASEAALRLEIAKQYPDFDIGPNYAFEEGSHLFSIVVGLVLPISNRNQGPIAEAEGRRKEMAAQFLAVQASGIAGSEQALAKYSAALNQLAAARQLLQQSAAQEQTTQKALQAGESDRVTLNGAELETVLASVAQLEALASAQQSLGDLENAVQRPLLAGDIEPLSLQSPILNSPTRKQR